MSNPTRSSEFDLIHQIRQQALNQQTQKVIMGIGDDCALLRSIDHPEWLVTTDMLMDGRHFRLDEAGAKAVGRKAMAVNLSDIAAMAGVPIAAFVSVALPKSQAAVVAQELLAGLMEVANEFQVTCAGGDTNVWDGPLVINVTLLGQPTALGAVRRAGAKPGDLVCVTGRLGGSILGRHLCPRPRIHEALELQRHVKIHAMIDISDGLLADLNHILEESGNLGAILDESAIPIHPDALILSQSTQKPPLEHALSDGEDFELCCVLPPTEWPKVTIPLWIVGQIVEEPGLKTRCANGRIVNRLAQGFDHFLH